MGCALLDDIDAPLVQGKGLGDEQGEQHARQEENGEDREVLEGRWIGEHLRPPMGRHHRGIALMEPHDVQLPSVICA